MKSISFAISHLVFVKVLSTKVFHFSAIFTVKEQPPTACQQHNDLYYLLSLISVGILGNNCETAAAKGMAAVDDGKDG